MAEQSAKNLMKLLEKSGLADPDELRTSLGALSEKAAGRAVGTKELSQHLVDSGVITQWHAEKLNAGKYKGFFLDKFKLLGHLGTGGMSSVYLAETKNTHQKRAIKVLPKKKVSDKSYLDRFYREAKASASLNHPNIVRIYDINNSGDTHYMTMEYVEGADLYEAVKADGPLSFDDAVSAIIQAAEGLQHAHDKKMVHRDVKPANLLRNKEGVVKILDLGLALFHSEDEESLTMLYNEKVMGTADYLSPEQAVNSHTVDHRADIYSLGCTLYFLLTGKPPFDKGTLAQRIAMHQSKEPAPIAESREGCPQGLIDICSKMMRKDPEERFDDCTEIADTLREYQKSPEDFRIEVPSPSAPPAATNQSKVQRKPTAAPRPGQPSRAVTSIDAVTSKVVLSPSYRRSVHKKRLKSRYPEWLIPTVVICMITLLAAVLFLVSKMAS